LQVQICIAKAVHTDKEHTHPHFWVLEPLEVPLELKEDKTTSEPQCVEYSLLSEI
jgi:hypothetical protein